MTFATELEIVNIKKYIPVKIQKVNCVLSYFIFEQYWNLATIFVCPFVVTPYNASAHLKKLTYLDGTSLKGVELVHLYSNTGREEVRSTYDADISLVFNYSTAFEYNLMLNAEICNDLLDSSCITVGIIWRIKMISILDWIGQFIWGSKHL